MPAANKLALSLVLAQRLQTLLPEGCRICADMAVKKAGKVALAAESELFCYFTDIQVAVRQQVDSPVEPPLNDILHGRHTILCLEQMAKMADADMENICQLSQGYPAVQVCADIAFDVEPAGMRDRAVIVPVPGRSSCRSQQPVNQDGLLQTVKLAVIDIVVDKITHHLVMILATADKGQSGQSCQQTHFIIGAVVIHPVNGTGILLIRIIAMRLFKVDDDRFTRTDSLAASGDVRVEQS